MSLLQGLFPASFLSYEDKNKCLRIAERIQELTNSIQLGEKHICSRIYALLEISL